MKELLLKHIVEIIFGLISGVLAFLYAKLKKEIYSYKSMQNAMRAILRNNIYDKCIECLSRGSVSTVELDILEELYVEYKNLNGNGAVETLYNKVKNLDIKQVEF